MANTRISSLTAGSAVAGTDLFPDVQTVGVGPVKVTATQLSTFFWNAPTLVTPNIGVATGTSLALNGATLGTNKLAISGDTVVSSGSFGLSGNISAAAWTTSGIRYRNVAGTLTDTSSTGTVATAYTDVFGGNTIAASNSTTFTDYYTIFVSQPTAGTNVTFTNRWAFGISGNTKTTGNSVVTGYVQAPQIYSAPTALTSGATISWDANVSSVASLTLNQVGATLTMSNLIAGGTYLLIITQGAGGNKTITTWTNFKWVGGAIPTLSSSAGAIDVITAYSDGTNLYASAQIGFA